MTRLTPVSNTQTTDPFVTLDRFARLMISAPAREKLAVQSGDWLYVAYDEGAKRIGIAKPDIVRLTDIRPYQLDARHYLHVRPLLRKYSLEIAQSQRYIYDGREQNPGSGRWETFVLAED